MSDIKTTYREIEIHYNESRDCWMAEDYREKGTLADMKEAIDRHLDKDPSKPKKEAVEVILLGYSYGIRTPVLGKTTGITEDGGAWFTSVSGKREKVSKYDIRNMFQASPENKAAVEEIKNIAAQIQSLSKKRDGLIESLTPAKLT